MSGRVLTLFGVAILFYLIGAKFPVIVQKLGI